MVFREGIILSRWKPASRSGSTQVRIRTSPVCPSARLRFLSTTSGSWIYGQFWHERSSDDYFPPYASPILLIICFILLNLIWTLPNCSPANVISTEPNLAKYLIQASLKTHNENNVYRKLEFAVQACHVYFYFHVIKVDPIKSVKLVNPKTWNKCIFMLN